MDCSSPVTSVHGIFQAKTVEWVTISYSRGSSQPKDQTLVSCVSFIDRQVFYHCTTWEDPLTGLFSSVQLLSHVQLFATPWTAAHRPPQSITNSQSLLKLMSIELVMPSNLLPISIFPSIRVFSNELVLCIRWPKYWGFSFSISSSTEFSGLISFRMDWLDLLAVRDSQDSSPTPKFKSINSSALSFLFSPTLTSIHDYWKNHSLD